MVDQASVKTNGAATSRMTVNRLGTDTSEPPTTTAVVSSVADFGDNLLTLAELQAKLAASEVYGKQDE